MRQCLCRCRCVRGCFGSVVSNSAMCVCMTRWFVCVCVFVLAFVYGRAPLGFMHVRIASSIQVDYIHVWNFNLNFGVVPVFILRICDFVHTIMGRYIAARDIVLFFFACHLACVSFFSQNERELRMQTPFRFGAHISSHFNDENWCESFECKCRNKKRAIA